MDITSAQGQSTRHPGEGRGPVWIPASAGMTENSQNGEHRTTSCHFIKLLFGTSIGIRHPRLQSTPPFLKGDLGVFSICCTNIPSGPPLQRGVLMETLFHVRPSLGIRPLSSIYHFLCIVIFGLRQRTHSAPSFWWIFGTIVVI